MYAAPRTTTSTLSWKAASAASSCSCTLGSWNGLNEPANLTSQLGPPGLPAGGTSTSGTGTGAGTGAGAGAGAGARAGTGAGAGAAAGAELEATTRIGWFSCDEPASRPSQITSPGPTVTAGVLFERSWQPAPAAGWKMLGFAPVTLSIATRPSVGSVSCSCLRESRLSTMPRSSRPTSCVPGGRGIDLEGWREESSSSIVHIASPSPPACKFGELSSLLTVKRCAVFWRIAFVHRELYLLL